MDRSLDIYIGWDSREPIAYEVAKSTILKNASIPVNVHPIVLQDLVDKGAYTREVDPLASTEFTYSRFFTPYLAGYKGWALFCDCDFLFFSDVAELLQYRDDSKAVACVKHDYQPKAGVKMDGKVQTTYPRKNWSSFMLFNCGHPSTRQLTPELINRESGAYLHRMQWAGDDEIGEIPTEWNWLEGWNDKPATGYPHAVHFTNGGPWFKDWQNVDYGDIWTRKALEIDPEFKPI
jgi:lipopolysaccharide biosynthesis glycosyltransferase